MCICASERGALIREPFPELPLSEDFPHRLNMDDSKCTYCEWGCGGGDVTFSLRAGRDGAGRGHAAATATNRCVSD